jgi:hypothetical protein
MTDTIPEGDEHIRPNDVTDQTIAALGKVSEALETIEQARGHLFAFHQLIGRADLSMDQAYKLLQTARLDNDAESLKHDIIGHNVIPGMWTFQIVEAFDDTYYQKLKDYEKELREKHVEGRRHIFESEMKEDRRTHGMSGHEAR